MAINGFGRIGKNLLRIWLENQDEMDIVALNSTSGPQAHSHLFKYDSIYGVLENEVKSTADSIIIDGKPIMFLAEGDPSKLPWAELEVDIVIEATGRLRKREDAAKLYIRSHRVIITAPGDGVDNTIVLGINEETYVPERITISSACVLIAWPVVKVLMTTGNNEWTLSTIHAYTADQQLRTNLTRICVARGGCIHYPHNHWSGPAVGPAAPPGRQTNGSASVFPLRPYLVDFQANVENPQPERGNRLSRRPPRFIAGILA